MVYFENLPYATAAAVVLTPVLDAESFYESKKYRRGIFLSMCIVLKASQDYLISKLGGHMMPPDTVGKF